ncbi:hypothetical protein [Flavobacterium daejeonense]|uniref:hypothetical protein n=1 Tax=Flavobacterium daejeonense TaxID=350893 RepID=UPI00047C607B|nr:hypothetical protein [Flavobacterium daejeonense]
MKKLFLSAAIVLGSLTTMNAQEQKENATPAAETKVTEQVTEATSAYTEIKAEELPAAVTEALKKAFPTAILNKASVNDKKEYQLEVKVGDKEGALYADETGKWIQK